MMEERPPPSVKGAGVGWGGGEREGRGGASERATPPTMARKLVYTRWARDYRGRENDLD